MATTFSIRAAGIFTSSFPVFRSLMRIIGQPISSIRRRLPGSAYACIQIYADAIQRAGTLDPKKVRDAIAATNMMTVMGPMTFAPNGRGQGKYLRLMAQWQKGKDELVWPSDQAGLFPHAHRYRERFETVP